MQLCDFRYCVICADHGLLPKLYGAFREEVLPAFVDDAEGLQGLLASSRLPDAALVVVSGSPTEGDLIDRLHAELRSLSVEIPLIVMLTKSGTLPPLLRPAAVLGRGFPLPNLQTRLADVARLTRRIEEARLRRKVFGPLGNMYERRPRLLADAGFLIVGTGRRFASIQAANRDRIKLVGAFTSDMADYYLSEAPFLAVMIDSDVETAQEQILRLRADPRHVTLPIIAAASNTIDATDLYLAGATDVIVEPRSDGELAARLAFAARTGVRRRLANHWFSTFRDRFLIDEQWLPIDPLTFEDYLSRSEEIARKRGIELQVIWLEELARGLLRETGQVALGAERSLANRLASAATLVSRDEDLVVQVTGRGPVAVVHGAAAAERVGERVKAFARTTRFG
ncbi:hypothetical protein HPQ64_14155 [Rhizobiales bacterium]|uniref:hypothetical protein n=1 Tax=Hongsoonwoonella zoysiae TaxID=2821844 RepID=UPI001560E855|nr:hypothetical protein [Hongsoonwoonella zoysiae]NRG18831.1 hypothetical protein [Hongsoonwoonella zoysiae]